MMLALWPASLTFILIWASGISILLLRYISFIASYSPRRECREPLRGSSPISGLRSLLDGALFVGEDAHKVREARDVEDLHVMLAEDRKSTRLNSSHSQISYAVFCLKKK